MMFPQEQIIKGVNKVDQVIEKTEGISENQEVAATMESNAGPLLLAIAGFTALLRKKSNSSRPPSH